ncbi:hypothetical protein GQ457_02G033830 [Hibiscus cannabinus]
MDLVSPQNNPNDYPSRMISSSTNNSIVISSATPNSSTATATPPPSTTPSRYENQKRRDWNTFCQYLRNHRPPMSLSMCSGVHVLEFLRQAWGSLDALIGRLRAAYEEHGGRPEVNPFGARAVRIYLREVRDFQAKARGVSYAKKRKRPKQKAIPSAQQSSDPTPTLAADATSATSTI